MPTTDPNPDSRRVTAGYTTRELVDEIVSRLGFAEVCRRLDLTLDTEAELQQWADGADRGAER
jgi:hypothetical protein